MNQITFNHTTLQNFALPTFEVFTRIIFGCESFLESNSHDIFALCKIDLDDSTDSGNFPMRGYLSLIQRDSVTHMHGLQFK